MPGAFVDSNIVLGGQNERDEHHKTARPIVQGVDSGDLPRGRLLYPQLAEFLAPLQHAVGKDAAVATLDGLESGAGWRIEHPSQNVYSDADRLWKLYESPEYGDAVIAAYMLDEGMEYIYSLDDDFDEIDGVTRLPAPENPFA